MPFSNTPTEGINLPSRSRREVHAYGKVDRIIVRQ